MANNEKKVSVSINEYSALLSAATNYIEALERRIAGDFNNPWMWLEKPLKTEMAGKKGAWLANKSTAELRIKNS